jgi:hypothetical protein
MPLDEIVLVGWSPWGVIVGIAINSDIMFTLMSAHGACRGVCTIPSIIVNGDTNPRVGGRTGSVTNRHTLGSLIVKDVRIGEPGTFFLSTGSLVDEFFSFAFPFIVFKAGTREAIVAFKVFDIGVLCVGRTVFHFACLACYA